MYAVRLNTRIRSTGHGWRYHRHTIPCYSLEQAESLADAINNGENMKHGQDWEHRAEVCLIVFVARQRLAIELSEIEHVHHEVTTALQIHRKAEAEANNKRKPKMAV